MPQQAYYNSLRTRLTLSDVDYMADLNGTKSVGEEMTIWCKLFLTAFVVLVVAQTSIAAVLRNDPPIGACFCTSDINGLVASKRGKSNVQTTSLRIRAR